MKRKLILLSLLCGCLQIGFSQEFLEGLWRGTITKGGLQSTEGYKFELFLELGEKGKVSGRSYIYMENDEIIQMDVSGKLYADRSIYLTDIMFIPIEGSELQPVFNRKYQLVYSRSIWNNSMEGYWQEVIPEPFHKKRKRGKILLKKSRIQKPDLLTDLMY